MAPIVALLCALLGGLLGGFGWRMPFVAYALGFLLIPFVYFLLWEPERSVRESSALDTSDASDFSWPKALGISAWVVFAMALFMVTFIQFGFVLTERGMSAPATIGLWAAAITVANPLAALAFGVLAHRSP